MKDFSAYCIGGVKDGHVINPWRGAMYNAAVMNKGPVFMHRYRLESYYYNNKRFFFALYSRTKTHSLRTQKTVLKYMQANPEKGVRL